MRLELTKADFDENGTYRGRATTFSGDLLVNIGCPITFKKPIKVEGDLSVFSSISFLCGVEISGRLFCSSNLTVMGQLLCHSFVEVSNSAAVYGDCKVDGNFEAIQLYATGDLYIGGSLLLSSGLCCGGSISLSNSMNVIFGKRLHPVFPIQSIDYAKLDDSDQRRRLSVILYEDKSKATLVPFEASMNCLNSLDALQDNYPGADEFIKSLTRTAYGENDAET